MSIVQVNFFSEALLRYVNFTAIIPIDKRSVDGEERRSKEKTMKTLYLLHGIFGCEYDWLTRSRIARWAQERNLAVIMPAGENKFYSDMEATGDNFGKFIGEDLVDFTRTMFRLSDKKEDTFIAGLSMGGLGALLAAFRYPDTFSRIGAFSSALILEKYPEKSNTSDLRNKRSLLEAVIGPEEDYPGSENDYYSLAKQLCTDSKALPKIFMSCGLQDGLLEKSRQFHNYLSELGYSVDYNEENGNHEWDFWDRQLLRFLDWLPTESKNIAAEQ